MEGLVPIYLLKLGYLGLFLCLHIFRGYVNALRVVPLSYVLSINIWPKKQKG